VKVRFQADADLNEDIVKGVLRREPSVDFRTATVAAFEALSDREVLAISARDGRVLVSHDRRTMPGTFAQFVAERESPGLIIVSQGAELRRVIEDLLLIWAATDSEDWVNRIVAVPL